MIVFQQIYGISIIYVQKVARECLIIPKGTNLTRNVTLVNINVCDEISRNLYEGISLQNSSVNQCSAWHTRQELGYTDTATGAIIFRHSFFMLPATHLCLQSQHGMRSLPDTSTRDQQLEWTPDHLILNLVSYPLSQVLSSILYATIFIFQNWHWFQMLIVLGINHLTDL